MLATIEELDGALQCPRTASPVRFVNGRIVSEAGEKSRYVVANDKPVLIDFESSVIRREHVVSTSAGSVITRQKYSFVTNFVKSLLSPPKKSTERNINHFISKLKETTKNPKVLIIGGGSVGQGMSVLYDHPDISVTAFDVYDTPLVQFVADAHKIPIVDDYFDGVVIQAVLEHVLEPHCVVDEIWRILKPGGLVYAETPFMQQVHEGAYDFTRYTESGHRYLFRRFTGLDSGASAGPGRTLMWAVDYFARSVFRSRTAGKIAKLAFFWAQYFDDLIPASYAVDGASGVYFLGTKANEEVTPRAIIDHYSGAQ